jgi:hypothetical protein
MRVLARCACCSPDDYMIATAASQGLHRLVCRKGGGGLALCQVGLRQSTSHMRRLERHLDTAVRHEKASDITRELRTTIFHVQDLWTMMMATLGLQFTEPEEPING